MPVEDLNIDTKTHLIKSPSTIDFSNTSVLGLPYAEGSTEGLWNFSSTTTMADPGSGKVRVNDPSVPSATQMAISATTKGGTDRSQIIKSLMVGDQIVCQDRNNSANWVRYMVQSAPINNATWFQIAVSAMSNSGTTPSNNNELVIAFEGGGPLPPVSSVFGRTGAVVATSGDYTPPQVGAEPALGNPAANGQVISSTTAGVRSWITPPSAPVSSVFGRIGAVIAAVGDYSAYYAALAAALPTGGTAGQHLTKNSATNYDASWATTPPTKVIFLTSGTTYTPSTGVRALLVECIGGGGGGGGVKLGAANLGSGGGGGGGGYAATYVTGTIKASYTFQVGGGGAGGSNVGGAGSVGGQTFFDSPAICAANGGNGGNGDTVGSALGYRGAGGGGGGGTIGDFVRNGSLGTYGLAWSAAFGIAGMGGAAVGGVLRNGFQGPSGGGSAAVDYGGGGNGAISATTTGYTGGAGADGYIKMTEYF
jgi:hypothetical protein